MKDILKKIILSLLYKLKELLAKDYLEARFPAEFGGLKYTFSQQGEDLAVSRYFNGKVNGYYVDVGAFHPIRYSNTYMFYLMGWCGINIEANPENFNLFYQLRHRDININAAIGESNQELEYYRFNEPALNTFSRSHKELWESKPGYVIKDSIRLKLRPLSDIFKEYLPSDKRIDFLSVDVEDGDLDVLKTNDWGLFRPELVLAECRLDYTKPAFHNNLVQFMQTQGYCIWEICCGTIIFRDKKVQ